MYQFRKEKTSNSKLLLIAVFIFFTINNANIFFRGIPFLVKFLKGTFLYQLFLTSIITISILFFREKKEILQNKYNHFLAANKVQFNSLKNITLSLFAGSLIGLLSFFLLQKNQLPFPERSIVIEFKDSIEVNQPWQLYLHTLSGFSALESVERSPIGNSITFPISGNTTFSKLRLDPGDQRVEQTFTIDKIKLKKQNKVLEEISGPALTSFFKPIQHINSYKFDKETGSLKIISANQGDPQLALNLSYLSLDPIQIANRKRLICYAIFVTFLVFFTFLYRYKVICYFSSLPTNYSLLSKLTFALLISVGAFLILQKRADIVPLRILTVHLGAEMEVPQDNWKIYLNIEGYKEAHSVTGLKLGSKIYFPIRTNRPFSDIRIDPGTSEQQIEIRKVTMSNGLEKTATLEGGILFDKISSLVQITDLALKSNKILSFKTMDKGDPNFVLKTGNASFQDQSKLFEGNIALILGSLFFGILYFWKKIQQLWNAEKQLAAVIISINLIFLGWNFYLLNDWNYLLLFLNLFWLFVLPGALVKDLVNFETNSVLSGYVISLAIGISIILLPLFGFYAFNITGTDYWIYGLAGGLSLIYMIQQIRKGTNRIITQLQSIFTYKNALEIGLFNFLCFMFLVPIADLLCAPLHDPAVTSVIAHKIMVGGFIKEAIAPGLYTYPPNLGLISAVLAKTTGLITPKVVMFVTNYFTVLLGLTFGYFWSRFFNDNIWSFFISVLLIMFISPKLPEMYFTSGKNALVVCFFFWFAAFYLSKQLFFLESGKRFWQGVVFTTLLIGGFLFHYITFIIFPVFFLYFFIAYFETPQFWKRKILSDFAQFGISFLLVGLLFGALFFSQEKGVLAVSQHKINNQIQITNIEKKQKGETEVNKKEVSSSSFRGIEKIYEYSTNFVINTYKKTIGFLSIYAYIIYDYSYPNSFFKYKTLAELLVLLILYGLFFTKYRKSLSLILLLSFAVYLMIFSNSFNIALYGKTMRFLIPIITASFFLNLLVNQTKYPLIKYFSIAIILLFALKNVPILGYSYNNKTYSVLTKGDLEAFRFINEKLINKGGFLGINLAGLDRPISLPMELDGSLYLNMTSSESAISFVEGKQYNVLDEETHHLKIALVRWNDQKSGEKLFKAYEALNRSNLEKYRGKQLWEKMKEQGIRYIYSGAYKPWGEQISTTKFDESSNFIKIYNSKGVKIYEIKSKD